MKHVIALVAVLAACIVASFALAAPPPGKGHNTTSSSTSTSHGKSEKAKCRPLNLKGTVSGGTIALSVAKASGPKGKNLVEKYRTADGIARASERGEATTEDMRHSVRHYRALFAELLETDDDSGIENVDDVDSRTDGRVEVQDEQNVERLR